MPAQPKTAPTPAPESGDDLHEIMKEIESLQEDLATSASSPEEDVRPMMELKEFHGDSGDASMEETLAGMRDEEPAEGSLLGDMSFDEEGESEPAARENLVMIPGSKETRMPSNAASPREESESGSLTMTLSGSMTLHLKYEVEGQEVTVSFQENTLRVQLADGTEFKIPVRSRSDRAA